MSHLYQFKTCTRISYVCIFHQVKKKKRKGSLKKDQLGCSRYLVPKTKLFWSGLSNYCIYLRNNLFLSSPNAQIDLCFTARQFALENIISKKKKKQTIATDMFF